MRSVNSSFRRSNTPLHGGIQISALTSDINTTDQSSYTTATIEPEPDSLLVVFVIATHASVPPDVTLSGFSASWTREDNNNYSTSYKLSSHWAQLGASPGSGTITITATSSTGCGWAVFQVTNHNPSSPIVQSPTNTGASSSAALLTYATAGSAENRFITSFGASGNFVLTPESAWELISDQAMFTPTFRHVVIYDSDSSTDLTSSGTWDTANNWGAVGFEIASFVPPSGSPVVGISSGVGSSQSVSKKVAKVTGALCSALGTAGVTSKKVKGINGSSTAVSYSSVSSRKVTPKTGLSSLPSVTRSTSVKVSLQSTRSLGAGSAVHTGAGARAISGVCSLLGVSSCSSLHIGKVVSTSTGISVPTGVTKKVTPKTGFSYVSSFSFSTVKKVAPETGICSVPSVARSVTLKKVLLTSFSLGVASSWHSGVATRAVSGRCVSIPISVSTTIHVGIRSGVTPLPGISRVSVVKVSSPTGSSFSISAPRGSVKKILTVTTSSVVLSLGRAGSSGTHTLVGIRSIAVSHSESQSQAIKPMIGITSSGLIIAYSFPSAVLFAPSYSFHFTTMESSVNRGDHTQRNYTEVF